MTIALGDDHVKEEIHMIQQQADSFYKNGHYKEALDKFVLLADIHKQNHMEGDVNYAGILNNMGFLYYKMDDYLSSSRIGNEAMDAMRNIMGENSDEYAGTIFNVGSRYGEMGDFSKAEPYFKSTLDILCKTRGKDSHAYAVVLMNLAKIYQKMNQLFKSNQCLEVAHNILSKDPYNPDYATCLQTEGFLNFYMHDYDRAETCFLKALDIRSKNFSQEHPRIIESLHNLGALYYHIDEPIQANYYFQKVLDITEKVSGKDNSNYAGALTNMAIIHEYTRNYKEAKEKFQQALDICISKLPEDHPICINILINIGLLYRQIGEFGKARHKYQYALDVINKGFGKKHLYYLDTLKNLALTEVAENQLDSALIHIKEAVAIEDTMIATVFSIGSERQRMLYLESLRDTFNQFVSLVLYYCYEKSISTLHAAADLVLRRKSLGIEALLTQRHVILRDKYPHLKDKLNELYLLKLNAERMESNRPSTATDRQSLEFYNDRLNKLYEKVETIDGELTRMIPEMDLEKKLRATYTQKLTDYLPEGSVLIELIQVSPFNFNAVPAHNDSIWNSSRYVALVLPSRMPNDVQIIDLGEVELIDQMINEFLISITRSDKTRGCGSYGITITEGSQEIISKGSALRKIIFDKLKAAIGTSKRLFIAPDGNLTRLPFEVLPVGKEGSYQQYLIDDYHISYLSTGRDLVRFTHDVERLQTACLVAADPDYDLTYDTSMTSLLTTHKASSSEKTLEVNHSARSKMHFVSLSNTRVEGEIISNILGVRPWTEDQVLESNLKSYGSPRILHLATHGFFRSKSASHLSDAQRRPLTMISTDRSGVLNSQLWMNLENPMLRSGLALAGANTWAKGGTLPKEAEDGILTALDVTSMDLTSTELVVLSACDTGLGDVLSGEGVFGLRRSFVLAGAQTLVMSLWKVPDTQTRELMIDLYSFLSENQSRFEALRESQLLMKKKCPNPFYWGAFICQGNPGP